MLAIRQVTQLNQGKKAARIDGKKFLTFKERFQLEKTLQQHTKTWKHQNYGKFLSQKKTEQNELSKFQQWQIEHGNASSNMLQNSPTKPHFTHEVMALDQEEAHTIPKK
jgi:glycerol-3-phosphate O-acyltransferase